MRSNNSIQSAQRRRAGPTEQSRPAPQPSINSAQMFSNQQQQQQQQMKPKAIDKKEGLSSVSKMTIPQAITLITLRLGAIESKMMNGTESHGLGLETIDGVNTEIIQTILSRLDALERNPVSTSSSELTLLKQQFETIKQSTIQMKTHVANLIKENASLKTQIVNIKKDLEDKGELLNALNTITMENSQKIMEFSLPITTDTDTDNNMNNELNDFINEANSGEGEADYLGTDLKQLIESELRCN
jgi:hypothetical protein